MLRLVVFALVIPADTSQCERIFSLMNNIKTSERSSMKQQMLSNLMLWHFIARKLDKDGTRSDEPMPCRDVPVMAILKEFRALSSEEYRRSAHRPAEPAKYEYEKHRIKLE